MQAEGAAGESLTTSHVFDAAWTVGEVAADGSAQLTLSFDRLQMTIKTPLMDVVYDSQSTEEPQGFAAMIAPMMRAMAAAKFTMTMSPQGEITDVEVPEDVVKALAATPGAQLMGEFATEAGLKKTITQFLLELPETLEEGGEWTTSFEMANETTGVQKMESTYKYVGPKEVDGVTLEAFTPTFAMSFGGGGAVTPTVTNQATSGEVLFNREAGRLESADAEYTVDLTVGVGGRQMAQTITSKTKLEWLEEESE
jgi:hypothetical protein